ncbi:MAG: hypothetical protein IJF46_08085 [Bacteroidaceae bacterium]|nr:hypothetical protein [Bacteroidaceae bacterium]
MKAATLFLTLFLSIVGLGAQENWMSRLPDSLAASRVSVPGAHDAATGEGIRGIIKMGVTQEKSIARQWSCGIRAFDFRPAVCDGKLHICHGPLKTKITLSAAIDTLLDCLSRNPREYAIVLLRQERGNDNPDECREWSKMVGEYINTLGERAATFSPAITVGELRGKILFLSRNHYENCPKGARISHWSHSPQGTREAQITPYSRSGIATPATLLVQDFYAPVGGNLRNKKAETIIQFIDAARAAASGIWCINHLSGYSRTLLGIKGLATNKGYRLNAAHCNLTAYNYLTTKAHDATAPQNYDGTKAHDATTRQNYDCTKAHDATTRLNYDGTKAHDATAPQNDDCTKERKNTAPPLDRKKRAHPASSCGIIMIDYAGCEKIGRLPLYGQSIIRAIIEQNFRRE